MAGPALRAKEELFSFRKLPMGHYLLKKARLLCSRAYNLYIKIGLNSPEQQQTLGFLTSEGSQPHTWLGVLHSFPSRFSLTCVSSHSTTGTQSPPHRFINEKLMSFQDTPGGCNLPPRQDQLGQLQAQHGSHDKAPSQLCPDTSSLPSSLLTNAKCLQCPPAIRDCRPSCWHLTPSLLLPHPPATHFH